MSCALSPFALFFVFILVQPIFNLIRCLTAAAALSSAEQVLLLEAIPIPHGHGQVLSER